jgi:polygalacturonase
VRVEGIAQGQVHGRFATVTLGSRGSNIDFGGPDIKEVQAKGLPTSATLEPAFTCESKFVPMN